MDKEEQPVASLADNFNVYVESGKKRAFAAALDWPGWCRSGRDEAGALQALVDCAPRYAHVVRLASLPFQPPADPSAFVVVERAPGTATTDFGAPDAVLAHDDLPIDAAELGRLQALLQACWETLDRAARSAAGRELRKGPRGGGRDVDGVVRHVLNGEVGYLSRLGRKLKVGEGDDLAETSGRVRQAVLEALALSARGEAPTRGPRGGVIWPARTFVRRTAWHVLDHAWEIEDRVLPAPSAPTSD